MADTQETASHNGNTDREKSIVARPTSEKTAQQYQQGLAPDKDWFNMPPYQVSQWWPEASSVDIEEGKCASSTLGSGCGNGFSPTLTVYSENLWQEEEEEENLPLREEERPLTADPLFFEDVDQSSVPGAIFAQALFNVYTAKLDMSFLVATFVCIFLYTILVYALPFY